MNRSEFRAQLLALDLTERADEQPIRAKMLELLDSSAECFSRSAFPAHFTGSALVVDADGSRALLHHHRKLDRWLQFGGHCDGDEDVLRVAQREALEESGIAGLIVASARPFDLDIHQIPERKNESTHWHYDVRYVFIAPEEAVHTASAESNELRWFTPAEMERLPLDAGLQRMLRKWRRLQSRRAHRDCDLTGVNATRSMPVRGFWHAAVVLTATLAVPLPAAASSPPSLVGRSDAELLEIMRAGRTDRDKYLLPEKQTALPPDFWTTPPREAALALVLANCSEETKQRVQFSISDPPSKQPPPAGEVGIRWRGTGSGPMAGGLTILRAAGEKSQLVYSAVAVEGEAARKEINAAVNRTRSVGLPAEIARQAFQVIWWLGRVRSGGEARARSVIVTHETRAAFWVSPGFARRGDVTLLRAELGEDYGEEFNADRHAGFADFVISEAAKHQPEPIEWATATLGRGVYPDPALKFLRTQERPKSAEETDAWITRTLEILRTPKYHQWQTFAIDNLVPWQEPMRYPDRRIDEALLRIARENLPRSPRNPAVKQDAAYETEHAVRALARRGRVEIFPAIMTALRVMRGTTLLTKDDLLKAAALLASRHHELRAEVLAYIRAQLSNLAASEHSAHRLFDAAWRFDFRELKPLLEELATADADEIEYQLASRTDPLLPRGRRFHAARHILLAWNEADPLTKAKLDAIYEASSAAWFEPAEVLRRDFEALTDEDKDTFRGFVEWMKAQKLPYNWSPRRAEWAISPEALAAAR
jgi:8-oxo-dGTP pyrophosphatase MutT (NUDIX family)